MSAIMLRQSWALSRRYFISLIRSPIKSFIRILLWPGIVLGLTIFFFVKNQDNMDTIKTMAIQNFIHPFCLLLTGFHLWSFTEYLVTDRATGMKSLMLSMGLERNSYYLGNFLNFIATVLPIMLILSITSVIYIFFDSQTNIVAILLVFMLFVIHLSSITFVASSIITSTNFVFIVAALLFLQIPYHTLITYLLKGSPEFYWPVILFFASMSPYEPIVIFTDSYTLCKNNCSTTTFDLERQIIGQPTYLILMTTTIWTILFFGFARWFEEVSPWQKDTARKSPLFCCKSQSQEFQNLLDDDELNNNNDRNNSTYFEHIDNGHNRDIGIQIREVSKSFKNVPAVDNLSFSIYKGETTLLLGHNGAGKTTLMNIILGKLSQDSGKVVIKQSTQRNLGLCPQTSVFDDNLNVKQHLELFFDIKAAEGGSIRNERSSHIMQTIKDVSLENHYKKLPAELSGGMKRKLSLAMAFIGKSDVLILDEPSSGLDPDSRVFIWNAIRRYRLDRTVLLSTQHMEEADYLGDRIAIMAEGKIICCGSSIFLNNVLGNSYKFRVECNKSRREEVLTLVRKYFTSAKVLGGSLSPPDSSQEMVIELIGDKSDDLELNLIKMLEYIENTSADKHGIKSYGLKSSSIEDVMLNTNKVLNESPSSHHHHHHHQHQESVGLTITSVSGHIEALTKSLHEPDGDYWHTQSTILRAFLVKHLKTYQRDWKTILVYRVLLPIFSAYTMLSNMKSFNIIFLPRPFDAFMIIHFIYYPTRENVSKFKTMQLTSNASLSIYWLSHLIIDFISIFLLTNYIIIMNAIMFNGVYVASKVTVYFIFIISTILFGLAGALSAYILSTILKDFKTCIGYSVLLYSISFLVFILIAMISIIVTRELNWLRDIRTYLFIFLLPTDAYEYIMYGLYSECYIKRLTIPCTGNSLISPVLIGTVALITQSLVYSALLSLIESKHFDLSWYFRWTNMKSCFKKSNIQNEPERKIDQDVVDESMKASQLIDNVPGEAYSFVASELSKSYTYNTKVINHLSFTVNKGECFGLLGINGAGKSTTFSMITAELKPDSGKIWCNGSHHSQIYRKKLGYDPQSNPEISLNSTDALYLMARLRRVNEHTIPKLVISVLELLKMEEHAKKNVQELSGGTKRKLSLGMSLIGKPLFAVLDEPTAGVDPMARVDIWALLRALRSQNNSSIVISSHAMEECEAVCDRIAIMACGRLRCIGTFLHLRSKFAQGGRLKVQFTNPKGGSSSSNNNTTTAAEDSHSNSDSNSKLVKQLEQHLLNNFGPTIKLVDTNLNSATFNIVDKRLKRSAILKLMREFKQQKHSNIHYILNDASLEDIFIDLARERTQEE